MTASVKRAMTLTAALNRLTFDDAAQIRILFSELIGKTVDDSFLLIPPFFTTGGADISVGRNVFINQNCTFYDLGGLDIADDVMIGPNVSLITSGHPIEPAQRRACVIAKPIVIERNVWIAAGAIVNPGSTIGDGAVINTGATVDHDCIIGDYANVSPGCHLSGRTRIGRYAFLGTGVVTLPDAEIGEDAVVGAGAVVLKTVENGRTVGGVPARELRRP